MLGGPAWPLGLLAAVAAAVEEEAEAAWLEMAVVVVEEADWLAARAMA